MTTMQPALIFDYAPNTDNDNLAPSGPGWTCDFGLVCVTANPYTMVIERYTFVNAAMDVCTGVTYELEFLYDGLTLVDFTVVKITHASAFIGDQAGNTERQCNTCRHFG